jgi:RpiR family transcriptional regulator, carbohydrate utilization regulator
VILAKKHPKRTAHRPVLVYLQAIQSSLNPTERRIADYIISDPERVISSSISELKTGCKASVGSIVAFCKRLNTSGYADFKLLLAGELARGAIAPGSMVKPEVRGRSIFERVFQSHMASLKETFSLNDENTLNEAAEAIQHAHHIEIFSIGMSYPIAYTAACKLALIGVPATATCDSHLQLLAASRLQKGDLAIGISCTGATQETVQCQEIAREQGASTICVTNSINSPITSVSEIVLCATPSEVKFFQAPLASRITQLALIDALVVIIAQRTKRRTVTSLQHSGSKLLERRIR